MRQLSLWVAIAAALVGLGWGATPVDAQNVRVRVEFPTFANGPTNPPGMPGVVPQIVITNARPITALVQILAPGNPADNGNVSTREFDTSGPPGREVVTLQDNERLVGITVEKFDPNQFVGVQVVDTISFTIYGQNPTGAAPTLATSVFNTVKFPNRWSATVGNMPEFGVVITYDAFPGLPPVFINYK